MEDDDEAYYAELEKNWRASNKISDKELIEVFGPDVKDIVEQNIQSYTEQEAELKLQLRGVAKEAMGKLPPEERWLTEALLKQSPLMDKILDVRHHLARLHRLKRICSPARAGPKQQFSELVEKARAVSIEQVALPELQKSRKVGNKVVASCPFHDDKSPSFYLYLDTNTFHCFGCQEHGDVITFVIKLHGYSFKEAVQYLADM